jgi:hypothetical protein
LRCQQGSKSVLEECRCPLIEGDQIEQQLARKIILSKVSGALATDGRTDTSDSIIGKGLFVGMKLDDAWCIVPNNGEPEKSVAGLPVAQASVVIDHSTRQ